MKAAKIEAAAVCTDPQGTRAGQATRGFAGRGFLFLFLGGKETEPIEK